MGSTVTGGLRAFGANSPYGLAVTPAVVRRFPDAIVGDEIARNAVDAGRYRVLVVAAAVRLGDLKGHPLVVGRPRDDAAGVVALGAVHATTRQRQAQRRYGETCPDHCTL